MHFKICVFAAIAVAAIPSVVALPVGAADKARPNTHGFTLANVHPLASLVDGAKPEDHIPSDVDPNIGVNVPRVELAKEGFHLGGVHLLTGPVPRSEKNIKGFYLGGVHPLTGDSPRDERFRVHPVVDGREVVEA